MKFVPFFKRMRTALEHWNEQLSIDDDETELDHQRLTGDRDELVRWLARVDVDAKWTAYINGLQPGDFLTAENHREKGIQKNGGMAELCHNLAEILAIRVDVEQCCILNAG